MNMKTELSRKGRTAVSGVAALAITAILVSTLVEALNPALIFTDAEYAAPATIAAASARKGDLSILAA
jgi:hypothetical protein